MTNGSSFLSTVWEYIKSFELGSSSPGSPEVPSSIARTSKRTLRFDMQTSRLSFGKSDRQSTR